MKQIASDYGTVNGIMLSFAFGVIEYRGGDLHKVTGEMDRLMYENKMKMKAAQSCPDGEKVP